MIRILLVEARAIVLCGLKQVLQLTPDIAIVAEATSVAQARKLIHTCEWDAMVLDLTLHHGTGLAFVEECSNHYPDRPTLLFTLQPDEQVALRGLKIGAAGYLTIDASPDELVTALRSVVKKRKYVPLWLAERMIFLLQTDLDPHNYLSNREYEVFCLLATGKTVTEIAKQLILSVKTISTYRSRILEKIQVENTAQLMWYAVSHGLVKTPETPAKQAGVLIPFPREKNLSQPPTSPALSQ